MTPEQALDILDRAASLTHLTRREHGEVLAAVETLAAIVKESGKNAPAA
jgi:hypothetical protein